jgi:hypothetical protein
MQQEQIRYISGIPERTTAPNYWPLKKQTKNDNYLISSLIRRKQWYAVKQQSTSLFGKS